MKSAVKLTIFDQQRQQIIGRAKSLVRTYDFYAGMPIAVVVLEIRAFVRSCEAHRIDDPDDFLELVDLMFKPHPACIEPREASFVAGLLANTDASPHARVRAIRNVLTRKS